VRGMQVCDTHLCPLDLLQCQCSCLASHHLADRQALVVLQDMCSSNSTGVSDAHVPWHHAAGTLVILCPGGCLHTYSRRLHKQVQAESADSPQRHTHNGLDGCCLEAGITNVWTQQQVGVGSDHTTLDSACSTAPVRQ
jgi:hypothetical protein